MCLLSNETLEYLLRGFSLRGLFHYRALLVCAQLVNTERSIQIHNHSSTWPRRDFKIDTNRAHINIVTCNSTDS